MHNTPEFPPGVTVLERGWLSSNNIVSMGRHGTALVDSGYATHAPQTAALVQQALGPRKLDRLVNTHLHSDHCGGNALLQSTYPQLATSIPHGLAKHVRQWDPVALGYAPTGQQCPPFRYDTLLRNGDSVELGDWSWQVHSAPGHDPDAVILFQPDYGVLISGDALWENGFGVVFPELENEPGFAEVAQTLDLIESLRPRSIIPGHGAAFGNVPNALSIARKRLEGFVNNPDKHALHAGKVLLKFKLLELQQVARKDLEAWALQTRYVTQLHERHFSKVPITSWLTELLLSLERSGALRTYGDTVFNQ